MNMIEIYELLEKFPKAKLNQYETPIFEIENYRKMMEIPATLYIKRDDLNGMGIGGNKVRNLEYLLGDAISKGADTIIASGTAQSNLCSLAAACGNRMNLRTILVHNDEEPEVDEGNVILNKLFGAEAIYLGKVDSSIRADEVENLSDRLKSEGVNPYIIYNGASTPMGSLGYVEAVAEIGRQNEEQGFGIKHLFVPGGNGGLAAGAIVGNALLDEPFTLHVVSVEYAIPDLKPILEDFVSGTLELLGVKCENPFEHVIINDDYMGVGWGVETEESVKAIYDLARYEGILLEKVYTAKTFYGMTEIIKKNNIREACCYLHSGGMGALFSQFGGEK